MLTPRQNLLETIRGGNPDRFVNQFEAFQMLMLNPYTTATPPFPEPGGPELLTPWGVSTIWPLGNGGAFPIHSPEKTVCKDITQWSKYVKAPVVPDAEEIWAPFAEMAAGVDRNEFFATHMVAPGMFEQMHFLQGMEECLVNFYEEPECTHELLEYIAEWELGYAELVCKYMKPDALFHHDDWGTQISTFLSPDMFREFLLPVYKKVYGYYKSHGVEVIVHHSDSYGATLVPYMIEMGIDIWQGPVSTNNLPELIKQYGGQISFMGGIDSSVVDCPDWTPEKVAAEVRKACESCGTKYFIPNTTQGLFFSTFEGVYDTVTEEIDKMSKEMF